MLSNGGAWQFHQPSAILKDIAASSIYAFVPTMDMESWLLERNMQLIGFQLFYFQKTQFQAWPTFK